MSALCQGLCPPPDDLSSNSFVSQFICLPGPVSGAVSASGGFVSQFICLPIHLSPRSCVRGCVHLRTICLPIHLSPNSFVSQVLVSQFICLPGPVAGAVSASGGLVSQFICLPIHLSPRSCVRGCVRLRGICLPIRLSSIIPQTAYCWGTQFYLKMCPPCVRGCVRLPGLCVSHHLSPILCLPCPVSGAVSASLGFVSPISPQTVYCRRSQFSFKRCPAMFRWCCLALRMSGIHLSPCGNSFVSQSGWWCPALWLSPIHLFALISTHLFPNLAGGVPLSGCLQFICLPLYQLICFPVWLVVSGSSAVSNSFVSPCGNSFPKQLTVGVLNSILRCVRLVSGAVSASLGSVSPIICLPSFVSHVLCQGLCPPPWALCLPSVPKQFTVGVLNSLSSGVRLCSDGGVWLSGCPEFICPLVAIHLSPNLAGGVQLSGCLQFICLPLSQLICFPIWLVVSRSLAVSNSFVCPYINSFVSQSGWWCPALRLSPIHLSPLVATHLSPNLAGGVRLWLSPIHLSCLVATHLSPSLAGGVRVFGCLSHAGDVRLFGCL